MVNTVKFSEFAQADITDSALETVGLSGGANTREQKFVTWTLSTRPTTPYGGLLGYNSETVEYEFWDGISAWIALTTGGSGVTAVATGTGLTGGTITTTGTISFAPIAANSLWANTTGGTAVPTVIPLSTFLLSANNLSDVPSKSTARTNLGLAIGTNVEAWSLILDQIAAGIWTGATSITTLGTITTGTWHATPVEVLYGGTGNTGFTAYSVICAGTTSTNPFQNVSGLGVAGQVLTSNGAGTLPTWQATSGTGTVNPGLINQLGYYAAAGSTISGLTGANNAVLVTGNTGVPSWLSGSGSTGNILQSNSAAAPSFSTSTYPSTASTSGKIIASDGTNFIQSTATFPVGSATAGKIMQSDGTNWVASTLTWPTTSGTAGKVVISNGTNNVYSTPTFPNTSAAAGKFIQADGTNWIESNPKLPLVASTSGKIMQSNGTDFVMSTPTWPTASGSAGQLIRSDGTNNVYTTSLFADTYAASSLLYSNGANNVVGLSTGNNGVLVTSGAGVPSISSTLPNAVQDNITRLGTVGVVGGALNMSGFQINNGADPTSAQDFATKAYVDSVAGGFTPLPGVVAATTTALTVLYNNGVSGVGATLTNNGAQATFTIDGQSPSINQRVLIKDQVSQLQNGIYTVTNVGSGVTNWILTRATNYDTPAEIQPGGIVFVQNGTVNAGSTWVQTATVTAVGVDSIVFSAFFTPSSYLKVANNLSDVASTSSSFNNISPLTTKGDIVAYSTTNTRLGVATGDGKILQVSSGAATGLAWSTPTYPSASGTSGKFLISDGTNNVYSTSTIPTSAGATANKVLLSDGTNYVLSTPTFPNASATTGKFIRSDGTNWVASTPTLPTTAGTSGKVLQSDGTNYVESVPTYPKISGTSGLFLVSDGTNIVYSVSTIPTSAGATANKLLLSDGTNYVLSTPTFPNASATTRKIIVSDGTNWVASTETYAVPGTSGNVMTSNGTNWTSVAPASAGTVTSVATSGLATGGTITSTGTITVTAASASDQATGTSTTVAVVPNVQQNHKSATKVWINFSGSTPTNNDSYNVSNLVKNSTGNFTISFTTSFANANFSASGNHSGNASNATGLALNTFATGSIIILTDSGGALVNPGTACLNISGEQ